jgi:hypothetical protein
MGGDTPRNTYSSFPEINELCNVTSCWKYIKRNVRSFLLCTRYCSVDEIKDVCVDAVCSVRGRDQRCMQKLVGNPEDKMCLGRLTILDVD